MVERWKNIKGLEGYQISNFGRVINNNKLIIKSHLKRTGYLSLSLWKNSNQKSYLIHRLVAEHFLDNPLNKRTVNHKDGNKLNNCISNLEWCTYSENVKHAYKNNLMKGRKADKHHYYNISPENHPMSKKVINVLTREIFKSAKIAYIYSGFKYSYFSSMLKGTRTNKTNFKYCDDSRASI